MALNATIYRCSLQVSDLDRGYYQAHTLTVAKHPSETDERMMVRLLAFALHADQNLQFTRGLSRDDEPDLWRRSPSEEIELWIEIGQVDEKRIRKACSRAAHVVIYTFQPRASEVWWKQIEGRLQRFKNLTVCALPPGTGGQIAGLVRRNMDLQCTVQDGEVWLSDADRSIQFTLRHLR